MKIKNIEAICKKKKYIHLLSRPSWYGGAASQYIGDGNSLYPVSGLPELDKDSILAVFDIPEAEREKYNVTTAESMPGVNIEDNDDGERLTDRSGLYISYNGRELKPLLTADSITFIDTMYLKPLLDKLSSIEFYERRTTDGKPYIAAKAGLILQAVIMPYDVINAPFADGLAKISALCRCALFEREQQDKEKE